MSCQPGRVATSRFASTTTARSASCGIRRPLRCGSLRSLAAWQTGQSEMPSTCEVAHRVTRIRSRRSSARWSRPARSSATAIRTPPAADRRTPGCCAERRAPPSAAASADPGCPRRAGTRGTDGRGARSATGRGCCGAGTRGCSRARARARPRTRHRLTSLIEPNSQDRKRNGSASSARTLTSGFASARVVAAVGPGRPGRPAPRRACRAPARRGRPRWSRRAGACAGARRRPARSPARTVVCRPRRALRIERAPRREQRAGQVLWLVAEVRDEVAHDDFSSIRIERMSATDAAWD